MAIQRMGDMLVEAGVITRQQLNEALRSQAHAGGRLGTNLVELGFIDEKTLATFLAKQSSVPMVTAAQIDRITPSVLAFMNAHLAERLRALPVREDSGRLWVAMADPTDKVAIVEIEQHVKRPVRTMVAPELLIQYALEKHYKVRRKPRVVEVRTTSNALLEFEHHQPSQVVKPGAAPALYDPSAADSARLRAVTGYLDDESAIMPQPVAPPQQRLTLKAVVDILVTATTDETVLDVAARFMAQGIPRVWVFLLKQGDLVSWGGRGIDPQLMAGLRVKLTELPLVAQALSTGETLAGRVQPQALGKLAQPMMVWGETLGIIVPVRIGKHAVGAIIGVDATLDAMRQKPEIEKLAQKLDQALHINYLRRLLLQI